MHATPDEIAIAIQQLRNAEADGAPLVAALRERGARAGHARRIRDRIRYTRSARPYVRPTEGPLVEMFPDLPSAQGSERVFSVEEPASPLTQRDYERHAIQLIEEIRSIDPTFQSPSLQISRRSPGERTAHLDNLRLERAALLWRSRQEIQPLQVEMIRFAQRRVDLAYADSLTKEAAGELDDTTFAVGKDLDWKIRLEFRQALSSIGIEEDDVIGANRAIRGGQR